MPKMPAAERFRAFKRELLAPFHCICCGESDPLLIDWHHVEPEHKLGSIFSTRMLDRNHQDWWDEVMKCVPVCVSCHRKIHANRLCLINPSASKQIPATGSTCAMEFTCPQSQPS